LPTLEPTGTKILVEVTNCEVCHSDLHIWEGYYDVGGGQRMSLTDRGVVLPRAMVHEIVGRVVKLGPDVKGRMERLAQYSYGTLGRDAHLARHGRVNHASALFRPTLQRAAHRLEALTCGVE
jgi:NADPH:quinone reductase-like Zn-dependent oxidoreductase